MEHPIASRIESLINALKMNRNTFAKSLNKSFSSIQIIVEGKSKPGYDLLETILLAYPQVNPSWLMKGEGEMFLNEESKHIAPTDYLQNHLQKLEESFQRLNQQIEVKDKQIEYYQRQNERLMDLLGKPSDVIGEAKVMPLWKKEEIRQIV